MAKKKTKSKKNTSIFVSFDAPDDRFLKEAAIGQTKNKSKPYNANDKSLKQAQPQNKWEKEAKKKIAQSDKVVVMLGDKTHKAKGVKKEIEIARKLGKEVVQVKPKDSNAKRVKDGGRLYNWTDENMKKILKKKK